MASKEAYDEMCEEIQRRETSMPLLVSDGEITFNYTVQRNESFLDTTPVPLIEAMAYDDVLPDRRHGLYPPEFYDLFNIIEGEDNG